MKGQSSIFNFLNKKIPPSNTQKPSSNNQTHPKNNQDKQPNFIQPEPEVLSSSKGRLKKKIQLRKDEQSAIQFIVPQDPIPQVSSVSEDVQYQRFVVGSIEEQDKKKKQLEQLKALEKKQKKQLKKNSETKFKPLTEEQKKRLKQESKKSKKQKLKQTNLSSLKQQIEGNNDLDSDEQEKLKRKAIQLSNQKTQISQDYELAQRLAMEDQLQLQNLRKKRIQQDVPNKFQKMAIEQPLKQSKKIIKEQKNQKEIVKQKIQEPKKSPRKKSRSKSKDKSTKSSAKQKKIQQQKINNDQQNDQPFSGKIFVFTGDFKIAKERIEMLVTKLGGKITGSVSGKTSFLLQGYASPDGKPINMTIKSKKAIEVGTPIIAHDSIQAFFAQWTGKTLSEHLNIKEQAPKPKPSKLVTKNPADKFTLWCQKYIPTSLDEVIGQQSAISKAKIWLESWENVHIKGVKHNIKKPHSFFYPIGDLNSKAMLFSGSPGLGKTTVARILGAEFGYRVVEFNASDTRNKAHIGLIQSSSYSLNFNNKKQKILLIMDEVDGLSGGDRGGTAAIIQMIKNSVNPIICICNDRQSPKIKSLGGHCYDVVFSQPTKEDVVKRLQQILNQEDVKYDKSSLLHIIETFSGDIRQILNFLNLYCMSQSSLLNNKNNKELTAEGFSKDENVMMDMWSASNKLLNRIQFRNLSMRDRLDLFFVDWEFVPLIIQNCLRMSLPKRKLSANQRMNFVKACDYIAKGDVINRSIRRYQQWKLMPLYGMLSSVFPTEICSQSARAVFPKWLGNNSKTRKITRELKELQAAFRKTTSGGRKSTKDYAKVLQHLIHHHLENFENQKQKGKKSEKEPSGMSIAVNIMSTYRITPDMLKQHLVDVQLKNGDIMSSISTAVKSTLTRTFNERYNSSKTTFAKSKANQGETVSKYDPLMQQIIVEEQVFDEEVQQKDEVIVQKAKGKAKPPPTKKQSKPSVRKQSSEASQDSD